MPFSKQLIIALGMVVIAAAHAPSEAQADGPLRRWWRNFTGRNCCQQQDVPRYTANYAATNPAGLQPGQCMRTCEQTCSRTVVNYVPQTAYRTVYKRVPVTQYRPVTNSDPCTGCTVTCMKPCTTYTYQCQRVPYTTYRPVYRQETYKVPVTTITNDCATGNCGTNLGCSTCATGGTATGGSTFSPLTNPTVAAPPTTSSTYYETPDGYRSTSPTPADQAPQLNSIPNPQTSQRPYYNTQPSSGTLNYKASAPTPVYEQLNRPAIRIDDQTASASRERVAIRSRWDYSPMRLASTTRQLDRAPTNAPNQRRSDSSTRRWVEVH